MQKKKKNRFKLTKVNFPISASKEGLHNIRKIFFIVEIEKRIETYFLFYIFQIHFVSFKCGQLVFKEGVRPDQDLCKFIY